ncbi:MAG: AmmeMemoRadiSam system protein B [Phycisphaerales bacterium]
MSRDLVLDALPEHLRRPHIRVFQPLAVMHNEQQVVVLRDPMALVPQAMAVPPQVVGLIQQFQGERTLGEFAAALNASDPQPLVELVRRLDEIGLLWGPTFERLEADLRDRLATAGAFPVGQQEGTDHPGADAVRAAIDEWLSQSDDPELEAPAIGIVAPHLDYPRGWPNYAAAYRCFDGADAPDRVVVLGTNHFGLGDGVVMTEWGFDTPLGRAPTDPRVIERLRSRLGEGLFKDQLDHHAEHSIKLQLPWIQHRFGDVPVVAALVPDPLVPMIADDGRRIAVEPFVEALDEALQATGGRTFFVASADLSHVGPQFGEPRAVDANRKVDVERHDRDLMGRFMTADATSFLDRMRETHNPTRWCSIGNMYATLQLARPAGVELIDYRQACDDQGACLVTSAAMALLGEER